VTDRPDPSLPDPGNDPERAGDPVPAESEAPPSPPAPPVAPPPPSSATDDDDSAADGTAGGRSPVKAIALLVGVVIVGLGAFFLLKDDKDSASPSTTSTTVASNEVVALQDAEAGFTIEVPKSWTSLRDADGEERVLLSAGGQNYFQLKVRTVDPATVSAEVDSALSGLEMITEPQSVTLSGQPATLYLYYTPVTESSPVKGVHVHYFLLKTDRLWSLVFQALPSESLNDLVPVFDQVAKSFKIEEQAATGTTEAEGSTTTKP
jgi:hypothetical protein